MRRVLHVLQSLQRSGMEMMLLTSAEEWRKQGYACDVLATDIDIGPVADDMRACGYGVFHIPFRSRLRYLPRLAFVTEFYGLCRSGYDVVHIHTEAGPPVPAVLAKLAGVRRVAVTPHGVFDFHGFLRVRKSFERFIIRMLGGSYGLISEGVRRCEWERFRNGGVRISNWLDTERFRPPTDGERGAARERLKIRPDQFAVVSVGNCSILKNHEAALRAVSLLAADFDVIYLHIGREPAENPERKLAIQLGIQDRVRFMGSQSDPLQFLWAADAFVMPSLHEGLGMAAIEAIAAGTSVVLSNVQGLSETAAICKSAVLTDTTSGSVASGLTQVARLEPTERALRAKTDSDLIRQKFSVQNGVTSITSGLYFGSEVSEQLRVMNRDDAKREPIL
jgi:glycosyltransferase involved in cell wall biosynthesis